MKAFLTVPLLAVATCLFGVSDTRAATRSPDLAFTYFAWNSSDFLSCESRLDHALELGFRAVTFVPSYGVDATDQILSEPTGMSAEAERCMLAALKRGYSIYYKPHLERFECWKDPARANANGCWRAWIRINPSLASTNFGFIFDRFEKWLSTKEVSPNRKRISVLIGAELENSLARYPKNWLSLLQGLKAKLGTAVLISPNWQPFCKVTATECPELRKLLIEADGFAPSVYGDFFHRNVKEKIDQVLDYWSKRATCSKETWAEDAAKLKQILSEKFSVGEFGIGPSLIESESWDVKDFEAIIKKGFQYRSLKDYFSMRHEVIRQWIDWAKGAKLETGVLNVWSGAHDPVGFSSGGVFDLETLKAFRSYTAASYSSTAEKALNESLKLFPDSASLIEKLGQLQGPQPTEPRTTGSTHEQDKYDQLSPWCDAE